MQQQMMQLVLGQTDEKARLIEQTDRYVIYQLFDLKLQTSYILCFGFLDDGAACFLRSSLPSIRDSAAISSQFTWRIGVTVIVIGMILAEIDPRTLWDPVVGIYTLHRLIIIPALVMLVLHFLPVDPTVKGVSILLTAMPAGSTTSMLAAKYDVDPQFATKMVVFSTLLSIPAILIWSIILV